MSAYATTARIDGVAPRLVAGRSENRDADQVAIPAEPDDAVIDVAVRDPLMDRLAGARERWSQMTFFLFDAQSWR
jgi:hypothetical protein